MVEVKYVAALLVCNFKYRPQSLTFSFAIMWIILSCHIKHITKLLLSKTSDFRMKKNTESTEHKYTNLPSSFLEVHEV